MREFIVCYTVLIIMGHSALQSHSVVSANTESQTVIMSSSRFLEIPETGITTGFCLCMHVPVEPAAPVSTVLSCYDHVVKTTSTSRAR